MTGADERTCEDRSERIYAHTAEAAEAFARDKGLFAASVKPAPVLAMQTKLVAKTDGIPDYTGLREGKPLLMALAVINFVSVVIGLMMTGYALTSNEVAGMAKALMISQGLTTTFGGAIIGVVLLTMSAACAAVRDIARNSWRDA